MFAFFSLFLDRFLDSATSAAALPEQRLSLPLSPAEVAFVRDRTTARRLGVAILVGAFFLSIVVPVAAQIPNRPIAKLSPAPKPLVPKSIPKDDALWHDIYSPSTFDTYLNILLNWTESPTRDTAAMQAELDLRLLKAGPCSEVQEETLAAIRREDPGAVFPIYLLDLYVWQDHLENRRFYLVEPQLEQIVEAIREFGKKRGAPPETRRDAATLLTFLAEIIWDFGHPELTVDAAAVLGRALDLDPDHVPARYLRLMIWEELGRYRKALQDIEILSARFPSRSDLRLRKAVQKTRLGDLDQAAALLDELTAPKSADEPPTTAWVRTVAFQERVRLELSRKRPEQAREILRRARTEDPIHPRLLLMETELNRRDHNRPDPRSRESLNTWSSDRGATPRLRYLQGPLSELAANREEMNSAIRQSAPRLAATVRKLLDAKLGLSPSCARTWQNLRPGTDPPSPPEPPALSPRAPEPAASSLLANRPTSPQVESALDVPGAESPTYEQPTTYTDPETGEEILIHDSMNLKLQSIYVTATRLGRRIKDIRQDEITVHDEDRPQEIVTFAQGDVPLTAILLIDASGSMRGPRLESALEGARTFMAAMGPNDRARLVLAADRLRGVSPFLSAEDVSLEILSRGLDGADAAGGTALFDHIFLTLDALEPELGRKVLIVLSDGFDSLSVVPVDAIRNAAQRSRTQLYWVRPREGLPRDITPPTGWRPVIETSREIHRWERTVFGSGGRVVDIDGSHEVPDAFAGIIAELRDQFAIGYYPSRSRGDGSWREVRVRLERAGVRLRYAEGYFDDPW